MYKRGLLKRTLAKHRKPPPQHAPAGGRQEVVTGCIAEEERCLSRGWPLLRMANCCTPESSRLCTGNIRSPHWKLMSGRCSLEKPFGA